MAVETRQGNDGPLGQMIGYALVVLFLIALAEPKQSQALTGVCCCAQSDWNVVKRGYYAHVLGEADNRFKDPVEALKVLKVHMQLPQLLHGLVLPACIRNATCCMPFLPTSHLHCHVQHLLDHGSLRASSRHGLLKALKDQETKVLLWLPLQKPKNGKPVSDQWVPAFVITDDDGQPNGAVQVRSHHAPRKAVSCWNGTACNAWH